VDWDIHHGDGTQSIFTQMKRSSIFLCTGTFLSSKSIPTRCDKLTFYPSNKECQSSYIGEGKGLGFNVNIAWETGTMSMKSTALAILFPISATASTAMLVILSSFLLSRNTSPIDPHLLWLRLGYPRFPGLELALAPYVSLHDSIINGDMS